MAKPFFTIGHSTRPGEAFIQLLQAAGIRRVIDVRTVPRSLRNPQYNADALRDRLGGAGIGYQQMLALGGLRGRQRDVPAATNSFWENESFHNYADYAMGAEFRTGIAALRQLGHEECCAIMCAEAVWWRCHRRIIADYLIAAGEQVFHILGPGHVEPARLTEAATPGPAGTLVYPGQTSLF